MSTTLKRPMFRKGGEVMEGIMTGIKPRKMFSTAGFSKADQNIVGDVRRKMNLIDFVSGGGSGLSDPLTQFLLTAGPDLVAGKAAGGSKIQEILGGVKPGIDRAIKTQQLKDLSDRKLATQLIAKSGTGDFSKAFRSYGQYMTNPDTGKKYTEEEFRPVFGKIQLYRKDISPEERSRKDSDTRKASLAKKKNMLQQQEYNTLEIDTIEKAEKQILNNPSLYKSMDISNPYIASDDYEVGQSIKVKNKDGAVEERRVFVPKDDDDFTKNKRYFLFSEGVYAVFDGNRLIEDTTVSF